MAAYRPVDEASDWLVGNPGRAELAAALWMGSVGLLILGLAITAFPLRRRYPDGFTPDAAAIRRDEADRER